MFFGSKPGTRGHGATCVTGCGGTRTCLAVIFASTIGPGLVTNRDNAAGLVVAALTAFTTSFPFGPAYTQVLAKTDVSTITNVLFIISLFPANGIYPGI